MLAYCHNDYILLICQVDYGRTELLKHHLTTKLLEHKWRSFGIWVYLARISVYAVLVAFLTAFAVKSPTPESEVCKLNYIIYGKKNWCI